MSCLLVNAHHTYLQSDLSRYMKETWWLVHRWTNIYLIIIHKHTVIATQQVDSTALLYIVGEI